MILQAYLLIKDALTENVPELKLVDLDLGQYDQIGEDHVKNAPIAYIKFLPFKLRGQTQNIQRGQMEFQVTLLSKTRYGDERDITNTTYINHLAIESKIYQTLQAANMKLSDIYVLKNGEQDRVILGNTSRKEYVPHDRINNLMTSGQIFEADFCDISASPTYTEVMAELELQFELVKDINQPPK